VMEGIKEKVPSMEQVKSKWAEWMDSWWFRRALILGGICFVMLCFEIANAIYRLPEDDYADDMSTCAMWESHQLTCELSIKPRTSKGLKGILFAPFLHLSFWHMLSNCMVITVLGFFAMTDGIHVFAALWLFIQFGACTLIWLCGRNMRHHGGSIIVFGFFGYHLFRVVFQRPVKMNTLIALGVTVFLYGGLIFAIFKGSDDDHPVSFEGHFLGFGGGVSFAAIMEKYGPQLLERFDAWRGARSGESSPLTAGKSETADGVDYETSGGGAA